MRRYDEDHFVEWRIEECLNWLVTN